MKKKIIIIGKKSFLAKNLFNYFNKRSEIKHVSFAKFHLRRGGKEEGKKREYVILLITLHNGLFCFVFQRHSS